MRIVTPHAALTAALLLAALPAGAQSDGSRYFRAVLSGANEVPPANSDASGVVFGFLDGTKLTLTGRFRGLQGNFSQSHIHIGAAGSVGTGIVFILNPTVDSDLRGGRYLPGSNTFSLTTTQVSTLRAENYYVNVHTLAFPAGELRDQLRPALVLSEIRVGQPGTDNDEYFELEGAPGASLDGYTYVVIGGGTGGGGVIESVIDLTGSSLPDDGIFFAAEHTYSLGGTPDLILHGDELNFEDSQPATHLLVQGFTGTNGQDLDTDDDGDLDVTPWSSISDVVGLAGESAGLAYGDVLGYEDVGPDGASTPGHVFRGGDTGAWAIGAFDPNGGDDTPGTANGTATTAGEPTPEAPVGYGLSAAYPNPFNGATTLPYTMAAGPARLAVYDVLGREVAVLVDGERAGGPHEVTLDGSRLPAGTYLVRLEAGGQVQTRRLTLVR